jgi:hypothetical protein
MSQPSGSQILIDISKVLFVLCSRDAKDKIFFLINVMRIDICVHKMFVLGKF